MTRTEIGVIARYGNWFHGSDDFFTHCLILNASPLLVIEVRQPLGEIGAVRNLNRWEAPPQELFGSSQAPPLRGRESSQKPIQELQQKYPAEPPMKKVNLQSPWARIAS
jgi:hypothetical protein